jgi:hypothetical protein
MKIILLISFAFIGFLNQAQIDKNKLFGKHWSGNWVNASCDTFIYKAYKKYDAKLYKWGGNAEGKDFFKDSTAQTYYNIHCSDESDPKALLPSKWWLKKDTLIIDGYGITETYKVLLLTKTKMILKLIKLHAKELKPTQVELIKKTN